MEPVDTLQHVPENLLGYGYLRRLKHQPPGMPHQTSAYLDELDLDQPLGRQPAKFGGQRLRSLTPFLMRRNRAYERSKRRRVHQADKDTCVARVALEVAYLQGWSGWIGTCGRAPRRLWA